MIDYDLPLMDSDLKDLRSRAYIFTDKQNNEYVKYKDLLESFRSKNQDVPTISEINRLITRVQAQWRCYIAQKKYVKMREAKEFKGIGQTMNKLGAKGVTYAD
jgi:Ca2+-binding EF-hand superfamily protein